MRNFLFILLLSAVTLAAADVSGKWSGKAEFRNESGETRSGPLVLILKQEGSKVIGTAGEVEEEQVELRNGKVEGHRVTFEASAPDGRKFFFDLGIRGDRMEGQSKSASPDGSPGPTAKITVQRASGNKR